MTMQLNEGGTLPSLPSIIANGASTSIMDLLNPSHTTFENLHNMPLPDLTHIRTQIMDGNFPGIMNPTFDD